MESDQYQQFLDGFKTKDGQKIEVPIEGGLGLLALGDIGLIAWRLKKKKSKQSIVNQNSRDVGN